MKDLLPALRARLRGDVRFDSKHRILYATDASLYSQRPRGVVFPRDEDDVCATLEIAAAAGVPVLPRGAGTSLAGQTTCEGAVVLDFTRHMDGVLHMDAEACEVRVQPGVVLDHLNAELASHGLRFGPDVATSSRATLGGMCGNNSCGAHSLLYGKMVENVLAADICLAGGSTLALSAIERDAARDLSRRQGSEGRIYHEALRIADEHADEIRARYPEIPRRVSGYNLDTLLPGENDAPVNLAGLVVGSEGTLATWTSLTLRAVRRPATTGIAVVCFEGLIGALRAAPRVREEGPAAVEVLDGWLLSLAAASPGYRDCLAFLERVPGAVLMVEFFGDSQEEVRSRLETLQSTLRTEGIGGDVHLLPGVEDQQRLWKARKAGLGLLMSMKGDRKPVAFVEDTAVPPERLADYTEEFLRLVEEEGARCAVYGHAAAGCLHTRPILSPRDPADRKSLVRISEGVARLVRSYGGCLSGEHGDGLSRSRYLEDQFGPTVLEAFGRIKSAFDPQGLMNPGKITASPAVDEAWRLGKGYEPRVPRTAFAFSEEGGMDRAIEMCNGMAVCRRRETGVLCPSFRATREEEHSTRGRANLLRAALDGTLRGGLASGELREALSLCLECKACRTECPTRVDMAKLKAETLHQARGGAPPGLTDRLMGRLERTLRQAARFPRLANLLAGTPLSRVAMERFAGFDRRRRPPRLADETFSRWWENRSGGATGRPVVLFIDTFTEYLQPQVGRAAVKVLEAAGYGVVVVSGACCGRTRIARGMLDEAASVAAETVRRLDIWSSIRAPIVGLEPSCLLTLREDLPDLRGVEVPDRLAEGLFLFEEFLLREEAALPAAPPDRRHLVHPHCHQRAASRGADTVGLLQAAGAWAEETGAGCCGMAGAFGYEQYDLSVAVAKDGLLPAIRESDEETLLVAPGFSCRQQIRDLAGREAWHPAEVLASLLKSGNSAELDGQAS